AHSPVHRTTLVAHPPPRRFWTHLPFHLARSRSQFRGPADRVRDLVTLPRSPHARGVRPREAPVPPLRLERLTDCLRLRCPALKRARWENCSCRVVSGERSRARRPSDDFHSIRPRVQGALTRGLREERFFATIRTTRAAIPWLALQMLRELSGRLVHGNLPIARPSL